VHLEKPAPGLATLDLMMSRDEVECRGGAGVDSGHDLLVGNGGAAAPRRGEGQCMARRGGVGCGGGWSTARSVGRGTTRCSMGAPPRGGLGRADGEVSHDE
jgi:hypothetical protein